MAVQLSCLAVLLCLRVLPLRKKGSLSPGKNKTWTITFKTISSSWFFLHICQSERECIIFVLPFWCKLACLSRSYDVYTQVFASAWVLVLVFVFGIVLLFHLGPVMSPQFLERSHVPRIVGQFGTGHFGTRTIWHQTIWHQDNLAPDNLAPGQFGTNIIKRKYFLFHFCARQGTQTRHNFRYANNLVLNYFTLLFI